VGITYTGCPTCYRTRHFFNNSNTNKDIATKFEQKYVRCVRNEEECVCSVCLFRCNIFIGVRIIKKIPGSVASGTLCISNKTASKLKSDLKSKNLELKNYEYSHTVYDWLCVCFKFIHKVVKLSVLYVWD
jgi:hypothetical protein